MTKPMLLIRADAGPTIGVGHVMRMLALGQAWCDAGGSTVLAGAMPAAVAERARAGGLIVEAFSSPAGAETARLAHRIGAHWVAADGYAFAREWQQAVRAAELRLLVVDDNAENRPYAADWVLNVNAHATETSYRDREPHTRLLLGTTYALVRREILAAARTDLQQPARAQRWLVTMGGADPADVTGAFLRALTAGSLEDLSIEVLVGGANPRLAAYQLLAASSTAPVRLTADPVDVGATFARTDLAFTAAGTALWELAAVGVPTVTVTVAENQLRLAQTLDRAGATVSLGDAFTCGPQAWLQTLRELSNDPVHRRTLVDKARSLIDGLGATRVVSALREGSTDAQLRN